MKETRESLEAGMDLELTELACPTCDARLYSGWRSPFVDDCQYCCTGCARRVEVLHLDLIAAEIRERIDAADESFWVQYHRQIESRLAACPCGGTFAHDAPRRCLACATLLPDVAVDREISFVDDAARYDGILVETRWR